MHSWAKCFPCVCLLLSNNPRSQVLVFLPICIRANWTQSVWMICQRALPSEELSSESKPGSSESRIRTFQHHAFRIPTSNRKQNWWWESKWGKRTPARCRGRDASNPRGGGRSGKYASRALERRGEHGAQRAGEGIGARTSGLSGDGSLITTNCLSPLHAC